MFPVSKLRSHTVRALTAATTAVALSSLITGTAGAQTVGRWQPWVGCWSPNSAIVAPITSNGPSTAVGLLCVVPSNGGNDVDLATIVNGKVAHLEHISATGQQVPKSVDNCPGWESATWSTDNQRVFLRSEFTCGATAKVTGSGILAISSEGEFVQIQGTTVNGKAGARAIRYQPAGVQIVMKPGLSLADSSIVETVAAGNGFASQSMRAAAGAPASTNAIADVAKHVDLAVAGAWLNEIGQKFNVSGKELVTLADAGVPPYMLDLMVAMSYPDKYTVRRSDGTTVSGNVASNETRRTNDDATVFANRGYWDCGYGNRILAFGYYGSACNMGYGVYDPYGFGYGQGYGYGYGAYGYNPYYYGQTPVVIVTRGDGGSGGSSSVQGRAVKGQGYTHSGGSSDNERATRTSSSPSSGGASTSSSPASSGSSGSSSAGSSSGGEARTAKPRPPGGL